MAMVSDTATRQRAAVTALSAERPVESGGVRCSRRKGNWIVRKGDRDVVARNLEPHQRLQISCFYFSVASLPSFGAPVPDEPTNSFLPSGNVMSRPLALAAPSFAW